MKLQINKQILEKIVWSYELETFTNTMTLIVMYDHGIINKQSFFQTWKNIKNGEFNKKKNIYHSKILDEWFDDITLSQIHRKIIEEKVSENYTISFDKIFEYFKLLQIDSETIQLYIKILDKYLLEIFEVYDCYFDSRDYVEKIIWRLNPFVKKLDLPELYPNDGFGHCCQDCDGNLYEYINRYSASSIREVWRNPIKNEIESQMYKFESNYAKLSKLHNELIKLNFYERFKIRPFFHNKQITNIKPSNKEIKRIDDNRLSYLLMTGRMGNGDTRIILKTKGNNIVLIKYHTDNELDSKPEYLGRIPMEWVYLDLDKLNIETNKFIKLRNDNTFNTRSN